MIVSSIRNFIQAVDSWNFVRKLEKSGDYTDILKRLEIDTTTPPTRWQFRVILLEKAKSLGYTDSSKVGMRSISTICNLWSGTTADKWIAIDLLSSQLQARAIQVDALKGVFSIIPKEDLVTAVNQHYLPLPEEAIKPLEFRIPIGHSGLHKFYFKNKRKQHEVALLHVNRDTESGSIKVHRLVCTMAQVQEIACLDIREDNTWKERDDLVARGVTYWKKQTKLNVRHIPEFFYRTTSSIFCENLSGGDALDYVNRLGNKQREQFFKKAGIVLLEYLVDIHKQGWVHRDIKPDNLLVDKKGKIIKVADFDFMARHTDDRPPQGSLEYCAPELFASATLDLSQDIYSLGRTLKNLRYGHEAIIPEEPAQRDGFDTLMLWMMVKNPKDRPTASVLLTKWKRLTLPTEKGV